MKYKIFEIDTKSKLVPDGYDTKSVGHHRLVSLQDEPYNMKEEHGSLIEAYMEIQKHGENLKHKTLTILPIIEINWEGKIVQHENL